MAEESVITEVKNNLADDAEADGWNDALIGGMLDSGMSVIKITLAFWNSRVAKLSGIVDVSESGSSRQLSNLFNQAKSVRDMWLDASKLEDNPPVTTRSNIRFHKLKRV